MPARAARARYRDDAVARGAGGEDQRRRNQAKHLTCHIAPPLQSVSNEDEWQRKQCQPSFKAKWMGRRGDATNAIGLIGGVGGSRRLDWRGDAAGRLVHGAAGTCATAAVVNKRGRIVRRGGAHCAVVAASRSALLAHRWLTSGCCAEPVAVVLVGFVACIFLLCSPGPTATTTW
jgi:hypothetical protein